MDQIQTRVLKENFHYFLESKYLFKKGYVAINGASLTIKDKEENHLTVALIPETLQATNLNNLIKGDKVNLEADQQIVATVDSASN